MLQFLEGTANGGAAPMDPGSSILSTVIMLVAMAAIFYFMLIRPENKRKKEAEKMRNSLKTGDKITTIGGIIGTVVSVKDEKFVMETSADQVRIELAKWAVSTNDTAAEAAEEEARKAQEAKARAKAERKAARAEKKNNK
jgi:preprotein translocase subunit YajC